MKRVDLAEVADQQPAAGALDLALRGRGYGDVEGAVAQRSQRAAARRSEADLVTGRDGGARVGDRGAKIAPGWPATRRASWRSSLPEMARSAAGDVVARARAPVEEHVRLGVEEPVADLLRLLPRSLGAARRRAKNVTAAAARAATVTVRNR